MSLTKRRILLVVLLFALALTTPLGAAGNPSRMSTIELQGAHFRSDDPAPPVGFTNRSISGTTTYRGEGVYRYTSRIGEKNTWNGSDYVPYIWDNDAKEVFYAGHELEFYDWYAVLKNSTATVVDDIRWVCQYWFEAEQQWNTLDLYSHSFLEPILNDDNMTFGQSYTDGTSTMNVTYSFRNCDEVKTQIDFYAATTHRYRFTWQLTGMSQTPIFLNDTIDSDGDGVNDTLGAVFGDEINFMWGDVNQTELDCWYNWTEVGKKLNVYIGNTTVEAGNILVIDPSYNLAADTEDNWWSTSTAPENTNDDIQISYIAVRYYGYVRFQLSVPQGATISSANLSLYEVQDTGVASYACHRDSGYNTTTAPEDQTTLPATDTSYNGLCVSNFVANEWIDFDMANVVQDMVDEANWASDNYMGFQIQKPASGAEGVRYEDYQDADSHEAWFHIEWSAIDDEEYNYVDNNVSDKDSSSDIGTHSSFSDEQSAPDSTYDTLTEANDGGGFSDWNEDHYDQENTDVDSYSDIGTQTNPTYANDSVNSQYMNIQEANQGGSGGTEWISTNAFDSTYNEFDITVGDSPWLGAQDQPAHYRGELSTADMRLGWFDFPSTTLTGTLTVNISMYCRNEDGAGNDWFDVWVDYTGSGAGADVGDIGQHTGWSYDVISLGTHTVAEVNLLRVYFQYKKSGGGDDVLIDHVRIGVSEGSADYEMDFEYQWTSATYGTGISGNVSIYVPAGNPSENLHVYEWDGTSSWVDMGELDNTAGWQNFTCTELDSATYYINIFDTDRNNDETQSDWDIDLITLETWNTTNFRLDLEIQWAAANYSRTSEYICIKTGTTDAEDLEVWIWDEVASQWDSLFTDLTASAWNNISVSAQEGWAEQQTITLRFLDDNKTSDSDTQDAWQIDSVVFRSWTPSGAEEEEYLFEVVNFDETAPSTVFDAARVLNEAVSIAETLTKVANVIKQLFEGLAVAAALTASKMIQKYLFESTTIVATLTSIFSASRTLYEDVTIAVTMTTTASLSRVLYEGVTLSPTLTSSASFARQLFEAITLVATVLTQKIATKTLYEGLTIVATLTKTLDAARTLYEGITIAEVVTSASSFARTLYESIALAATLATQKSLTKTLYEAVAITATISTVASFSRTLAEEIILSPTFYDTETFARTFYDNITINDTITNALSASRDFFDSITFDETDYTQLIIQKYFFENIVLSPSFYDAEAFARTFFESITIAEVVTSASSFARTLYENIIFADHAIVEKTAGLTEKYLFEIIGFNESHSSSITKYLQESLSINDTISNTISISRTLFENIVLSPSFYDAEAFARTLFESITFNETVYVQQMIQKYLFESINLSTTFNEVGAFARTLFESITLDEIVVNALTAIRNLSESLTLSDAIFTQKSLVKSLFEAVTIVATEATVFDASRTLHEAIAIVDSLSKSFSLERSFFEGITISEAVFNSASYSRTLYENIVLATTIFTQKSLVKTLFESIVITAVVARASSFSKTLFESLPIAEALTSSASFDRALFESIIIYETVYPEKVAVGEEKFLFETITLSEESPAKTIGRILFEAIVVNEAIARTYSFARTLFEAIILNEVSIRTGAFDRALFEAITLNDSITNTRGISRTFYEGITIAVTHSTVMSFVRVLFEAIVIAETLDTTFTGQHYKYLFESFLFGENDVWADYRVTAPTTTTNPDAARRRWIIPPLLPPNLVLASLGFGAIFWIYFYGVPYVDDSKAAAFVRREELKWGIRKVLKPILGPVDNISLMARKEKLKWNARKILKPIKKAKAAVRGPTQRPKRLGSVSLKSNISRKAVNPLKRLWDKLWDGET